MRNWFASLILIPALSLAGVMTVEVPVSPADLDINDNGAVTSVYHPEGYLTQAEGLPCLPVVPAKVALPAGCRATSMEVVSQEWVSLRASARIAPSGELFAISEGPSDEPTVPDRHVYGYDGYWPQSPLEFTGSGAIRGIPIATMNLRPVRWNPTSGSLEALSALEVRVEYQHDPALALVSRRTSASEVEAMGVVRSAVVNPSAVSSSGAALVAPRELEYGQYVIVTHPDYESAAEDLADWKTSKGIPTSVYTTDWVQDNYSCYDLQQEIRAFLTDCRDEGADYVLIVGDDDKVECRDVVGYGASPPCDLYFADINDTAPGADLWDSNGNHVWGETGDDVDYHPDLYVGRASVNSTSEADLFVDKVLRYEGQIAWNDYFETAPVELRIGYTTGELFSSTYTGSVDAEIISGWLPEGGWEEEKCYESTGNNNYQITIDMIDAGPHHVFHASHGGQTSMYTSYGSNYTTTHIMNQTNIADGGLPAIWNSIACLTGHLDNYECCADAWLASPDGGGFGAFNSRNGYGHSGAPGYGPSEVLSERFYLEHWVNDLFHHGTVHAVRLDHFCPPSAHADSHDVEVLDHCIKEYNLFGDPELPIWTEVAEDLDVDHTGSVGTGGGTVSVSVSDVTDGPVENARVCLQKGDWQEGEIYEVDYTDASGNVDIYVNPATTGQIAVAVWARNHYTYSGTVDVTSGTVGSHGGVAPSFGLAEPTPSPASAAATVRYSLPQAGPHSLEVYDLTGRRVATLAGGSAAAGSHTMVWDLTDGSGARVPTGIYHVRLTGGGRSTVRSLVVLD
jgi:hypothetical protein